jgi:UDP-N-acetyl-D-mannosaminuronic acid dehydrogenase
MNIGIIGLGYVGLTMGVVAAMKSYKVYGIERSKAIRDSLDKKKAHFFEPGLDVLIDRYHGRNLFIGEKFTPEQDIKAFVITVGTPLVNGSKEPNFDHIISALNALKGVYKGDQLIILRSTISVGTTRKIVIPHLCEISGRPSNQIYVAFCPERTIEGKAVRELQELPQIIGANNRHALTLAENFFREITPTIIKVDSLEAAELIKLFNNTYRDIHFAIGNVFNEIAQSFNLNGVKLIKAANIGYDRSNIPNPGFVGGPCLEKDPYILTNNMPDLPGKLFVINARKYNESLEERIVEWTRQIVKEKNITGPICLSGLAFKGVPDTSDLRGSNSVSIAKKLAAAGFELRLHDFFANEEEVKELNVGEYFSDLYEAAAGTQLLLILNNNPRYVKSDVHKILNNMASPKVVLDAWGVIDYFDHAMESDVRAYTLGNIGVI